MNYTYTDQHGCAHPCVILAPDDGIHGTWVGVPSLGLLTHRLYARVGTGPGTIQLDFGVSFDDPDEPDEEQE